MHQPVLYHEIIHDLAPHSGGCYVDCTVGAGGHAWGILEASSPDGRLLGMDVDEQALELSRRRLESFGARAILLHASYVTLAGQLAGLSWKEVDGILLDLGVSSMQLDTPQRGFSLKAEGPIDMRFDVDEQLSAHNLVNDLAENDLADILFRFGEERNSRRIARAIVKARPVTTTSQLAAIVMRSTTGGRPGFHPATRTFQALRIAVNQELEHLSQVLPQAVEALRPGGRLAVISFHSLEDRIVKQYFKRESEDCICPPSQPQCTCGHLARVRLVNRRSVTPGDSEVQENPRARSARLRVAEKL